MRTKLTKIALALFGLAMIFTISCPYPPPPCMYEPGGCAGGPHQQRYSSSAVSSSSSILVELSSSSSVEPSSSSVAPSSSSFAVLSSSSTSPSSSSMATYTVIYDANGGTGAPSSQMKTHNVPLKLNTTSPTRIGYTFVIWNTASNGGGTSYAPGNNYATNANATLYAQWKANTYTVICNPNFGTGTPTSQIKTHDVTLNLSCPVPTRVGYTFVIWNTAADGSGTSYAPGVAYTNNANITLYAQWKPNIYTVKYDANGATEVTVPADQIKIHDIPLNLSGAVLTRIGYTFNNWNTSPNGSGMFYAPGVPYTNNTNVTLYAQWKPNTYTVKYDANGITGVTVPADQTKIHDIPLTLNSTIPTKTGYKFVIWNTVSNGSGTSYAPGAPYINNAGATLYAQWNQISIINGPPVSYGGETYQTVVIGKQTWFKRNLNYNASGSKCYKGEASNCAIYGRLYDWNTAKSACPGGWHLPSNADWDELMTAVGGYSTAGTKLKSSSGWGEKDASRSGVIAGTDNFGFSALPGGYRYLSSNNQTFSGGGYYDEEGHWHDGDIGYWWSATEGSSSQAYRRSMYNYREDVYWDDLNKDGLFSVRCLKDQ